ncbi:hypothetical protein RYH80_08735 [Halobaculum sp. MBLA0147]|uniref:DUF7857 domain-containing protein n=1 Tax=Halobaculum sp. MBLA0147 TaxID=3079934 RepID=UPI003523BBEE
MTDQRRDTLGGERTDEETAADGIGDGRAPRTASGTRSDECHELPGPGGAGERDQSDEREPRVSLETDATVRDGVALVTCRLANETNVPRGVRIVDRLDGPTLPPRRDGVPEHGWDDDTYTTVVGPGETVAVGYACPVGERPLADPPATVAAVGDPEVVAPDTGVDATVAAARRSLDGWQPPRDAVPTPAQSVDDGDQTAGAADPSATAEGTAGIAPDAVTAETEASSSGAAGRPEPTATEPFADGVLPAGVAEYLDVAADRVARAEGTGDSVPETTAALWDTHHTPVTLEQAVARDAAALRRLAERAEALATRAAAADVPVDTLRRVA